MNKDILYRFFEGTTTIEEEESVRNWIESSDDNYADFLRERKIYDALLLSTPSKISRQSFHQHITRRGGGEDRKEKGGGGERRGGGGWRWERVGKELI
jgi:hypothetical protein